MIKVLMCIAVNVLCFAMVHFFGKFGLLFAIVLTLTAAGAMIYVPKLMRKTS
ncbi:hypothetical protein Aeh1hmmORF05c [Aeromonas phage Aeh1]|uniref:Uncharacterized protein n=1 Tax=Aeromonas phage Aeh1 TaxID=2880362 RepID=Q76YE7_9CAUD|nr:hypothetical protein Aeh1p298 [Aeromonas phage Aeh1]AAQ17948.1 hypothetical protein Aeh1hmmORF05c [Aeromonas phage Aeh1]